MTRDELSAAGRRLNRARRYRPYTVAFTVGLIPVGVLAVVFGDQVSAALGNLAANSVSRGMGLAMFGGGLVALVGIMAGRALAEIIGMGIFAVGLAVYGIGVVLGLGLAGMVAGPIAVLAAAATFQRIATMLSSAEDQGNGHRFHHSG